MKEANFLVEELDKEVRSNVEVEVETEEVEVVEEVTLPIAAIKPAIRTVRTADAMSAITPARGIMPTKPMVRTARIMPNWVASSSLVINCSPRINGNAHVASPLAVDPNHNLINMALRKSWRIMLLSSAGASSLIY